MNPINDRPAHYCGITGIISDTLVNMPERLFYALFSLQHRGQESCGIAYHRHGDIVVYRDLGMVSGVLSHYLEEDHPSFIGIGHVRYSTHGGNRIENAQPVSASCNKGDIAVAHNGNITNSEELRRELFREGSILQSSSDTELILHLIARSRKTDFREALLETLTRLEGAFSLVLIHDTSLIAARDPNGFRPLVMGRKNGFTVFASETCALDILRTEFVREVKPGECLFLDQSGMSQSTFRHSKGESRCIFELIYFARPDSFHFGHHVHSVRKKMGQLLAESDDIGGDIVCAVPDSGNSAALGYSLASGINLDIGLARNHYSGRTFIQPAPSQREFGVRMKLHPLKDSIENKKIILVDDSLVRGTTSRLIVKLLKEAGAKEVHLRLSAPEIRYPCFYGIDIPTREELISNRMSPDEIAGFIGANSVRFLPLESLKKCVNDPDNFCYACFSGNYPVRVKDPAIRRKE
ncbi:MAG: amidophosphoribosyltransferase [Spirochaetales bacterium]|nr:amidophosphoribosyltransferase [Spirochaetales bacterium]